MLEHDSMFFIGVFVFIFLLWLAVGGPTHPIAFGGPLLSGPDALGGGTYLSFPQAPRIGMSTIEQSHASGVGANSGGIQPGLSYQDQQAVNKAIKSAAFGTPSPYRGQVTLNHYISNAASSNPNIENVELYVSENASGPINISGWHLSSEVTGKGGDIPQGTELPRSGVINPIEPIVLNPGDQAYITSGHSPIGASFRENVCIGYFAQYQKFSPTLPNSCPTPENEIAAHYGPGLVHDQACSAYAEDLDRCSIALSPPAGLSSACQNFLVTYLNYNGCVNTHQNDYNFKGSTWRIYLGHDSSVWRSEREVVKLTDAAGKTVDMFTY